MSDQLFSRFHKTRRLPPYVFDRVGKQKAKLLAEGRDIIDLGMGSPDLPPAPHILETLQKNISHPNVHGYSQTAGILPLREAMSSYYDHRFGVQMDPHSEILVTIGSKEGFISLANTIIAPGDTVIAPDPAYPLHHYAFIMAGASIKPIKAQKAEDYLAGLERTIQHSVPKPTAIVVCFPSNPTTETCDLNFMRSVVALAKKHGIIIVSDLAYSEIYFGDRPPSIFEVNGAKDVAVEISSMSKTYNMAGWRVGFLAGNHEIIKAVLRVKSYSDYGSFYPIQLAAVAALNGPQEQIEQMRHVYRARRDVLLTSFSEAGWSLPTPQASMFCWSALPEKCRHMKSLDFSLELLKATGIVVSPGSGFGEQGEGYARIALVQPESRLVEAGKRIKTWLQAI